MLQTYENSHKMYTAHKNQHQGINNKIHHRSIALERSVIFVQLLAGLKTCYESTDNVQHFVIELSMAWQPINTDHQVDNDQEKAQSEKDSSSKNRDGKNQIDN